MDNFKIVKYYQKISFIKNRAKTIICHFKNFKKFFFLLFFIKADFFEVFYIE